MCEGCATYDALEPRSEDTKVVLSYTITIAVDGDDIAEERIRLAHLDETSPDDEQIIAQALQNVVDREIEHLDNGLRMITTVELAEMTDWEKH